MTFFADMPHEQYHASEAISKSGLDHVAKSIAHYLSYRSEPYDTVAMKRGRAVHQLLLEGHDAFFDTFAIAPKAERDGFYKNGKPKWKKFDDWRTDAGKKWKTKVEQEGLIPVHRAEAAEWKQIAESVKTHPRASVILESAGHRECSFFWRDEEFDVDCRARQDLLTNDIIVVDIKTLRDASPTSVMRSISKYRYDVQWEFYGRGIAHEFGVFPEKFIIIAVETVRPYAVAIYNVAPEWRLRAHDLVCRDLERWAEYVHREPESESWLGYPHEITTLEMPRWA